MIRLIGVELFKIRTQLAMRMMLLAALGLTVLGFAGFVFGLESNQVPGFDPSSAPVQRQLLGMGGGSILVFVFGILGITSEYRHRTITNTFLATPERYKVLVAKLVTYAFVAAVFGVVLAMLITTCVLTYLTLTDVALVVPWTRIVTDYVRDLAGLAMSAAFGFAVGALVTNQVAAIVIVLVEPIVGGLAATFLPKVTRFLPSQAFSFFGSEREFISSEYVLSPETAALVILGYVVVLTAAAIYLTARRDIT